MSTHLSECTELHCIECQRLMEFYSACDCCGHWMWNESGYFYDEQTGQTLCAECEP